MRNKISLLLLILFLAAGCAQLKEAKDNFTACKEDPICWAKAQDRANLSEKTSETVVGIIPGASAASKPVSKAVGYIVLALSALTGGAALRKKS